MRALFTPAGLGALRRAATGKVLLAFDFDGTLAPIVPRPAQAAMRPLTRELLRQLARLYPCVVISGRGRADLARRVAGIPLRALVGNHGIEAERIPPAARRQVLQWRARLAARLDASTGVELEDKGATLAVHYRNARDPARARRAILTAVAGLVGARTIKGKMVVDLMPEGAPNKATALLAQRKQARCRAAVYVGDDRTDEDAFALAAREPVLGIRVGKRARSRAPYYLPRQDDVDRLLATLIALRPG